MHYKTGFKSRIPLVWFRISNVFHCTRFDKNDFIGPLTKVPHGSNVTDIANYVSIEAMGHLAWSFLDIHGQLRNLKLPAYYIPKVKQQLLRMAVFNQKYPNNNNC